jgi:hypothetical protein
MKASLRFNLPEETTEHQTALDGSKWKAVVEQMDETLRQKLKYEDLTEEDDELIAEIREELRSLIEGQGLVLW